MTSLLLPATALGHRCALSPLVLVAAILGAAFPVAARSEPPPAPDAPTVGRVVGSHNSLGVRWTAPDNTGRPAIESYDVQFRTPTEPWWSMPPKNVAGTAATLTHLLRNTLYEVQVRAKNADGDGPWSESGWGTTGKNTAPSFGATPTTRSVAENTEPGQAIGDLVAATDPDSGETLTYSLGGPHAAAFDIDAASGQLRTSAALDYETQSSYSVTVTAEDSEGASASIDVTIEVTDANDPPLFDPADNMRSVAENTEPGQAIGIPVTATDPEGDTLTYSLEGTDADAFDIDATSGQLRTRDALDHETQSSYSVTVTAEDSDGASASIEVTIAVTNANEPPSFDTSSTTRSVVENTEPGQAIGDPVTATDPEGDTLTYSLEGTDADAFDIDATSGQLRTRDALDHETQSSYSVTVTAEDSDGASTSIEVTIAVTNANEPPSFDTSSTTRSVVENTEPGQAIGIPVTATDPEGDTLTYSLEGTDADAFDIDTTSGQLRTRDALDYETQSSYSVTVVAEDSEGASASIEVTISVTDKDENEPPSFDPTDNMRSVAENTEPGQAIGIPVTATDPEGDTLTYSLEGTDADAFDIDATSGQLRTRAALDHEAKPSYSVTVVALDNDGASASIDVTIEVTDANDPPLFDPTDNMRSVAENTEPGQAIGIPVAATDPEGDTLTYSLEGTDADAFDIDATSGQLRTRDALDYETQSSYSVTVTAEDSEGASASIEVTISVTDEDENEPPSFDPTDNMRSVVENTEPGQAIGDPVAATDPEGDTLTYSLEGTDADAFDIDATSGQLRTRDALDHEATPSYSVTVVARDSEGASDSIEVTIEVTNANEPPSFNPADNTRSLVENTEPGQAVGEPVAATDPDSGDTLIYSLEGPDAEAFDIDAASGQLLTLASLDHEAQWRYSVTVVAQDSDGASASIDVTIEVTDANDPPLFDPADNARSVAENTEPGRAIGAPVAASDPDSGDRLTYRLGGTDSEAFDIDAANGQLLTLAALDHEAKPSYSVTVVAQDNDGASASIEITIAVTNANEPPSFDPADNTRSVAENTKPGQAIGEPVAATDPDAGDTLTYSLGGADAAADFDIDATSGQLRTRATLDHEAKPSYSVTVVAQDNDGASASIEVTIAVTDANEPPSFDPADNTRSVAENTEPGQTIGDPVAATDPDAGDTLTYSLGGTDAAAFDIDSTSGQLLTSAALDHEATPSYSVMVMAQDGEGAGVSIEVTIAVADANEPPSFDPADNTRSVVENTEPGQAIGDPVAATDPDAGDTLTYSLGGTDAAAFDIDPASGQLLTRATLDHETRSSYSVTVEARDSEDASGSIEVTIDVTNANEPPSFDHSDNARSVAENTEPGQAIGEPVAATDPDAGDTLIYSLRGTDAAAFDIDPVSGQLLTRDALDHEAKPSYSVTVEVADSQHAGDSIEVTIAVADANEPPDAPAAPTFTSVTDESLTVSWTPPSTAGRPDITSYDLRYRAGTGSAFTDGPQDVTDTTATISGLGPNITYHVQVRATNDEGDGPWSAPGATITTNDKALQQAWLAHFGRTVAGQVVNAVSTRLEGAGGAHVMVDGTQLRLSSGTREARDPLAQVWPGNAAHDAGAAFGTPGTAEHGLTPGSSFHLTSDAGPEGSPALTAWGRYASESFRSVDEKLELDGDVTTAILGTDAQWDRLLAGVALSFSDGEGEFAPGHAASPGKGEGTLDSSLNSVHPYLRYEVNEGISVWGLAGYGSGDLTHTDDGTTPIDTDITMRMGALGARSELLSPSQESGLALALKSDVFWMQMESKAVEQPDGRGLKRAQARASRLRILLEGSQSYKLDYGARLTPSLEVGLRSDGGDAETGSGVEVRAGIRYTAPGMTLEASAHNLFGHQRREYEEWGASGSIRFTPGSSGRGLSLTVAPSWGAPASGVDRLWSMQNARRLTPNGDRETGGRLEAEIGYGVGMSGGRGVLTPYTGLSLSDDGERTWRLGGRWNVAPAFSMSLEGDLRENADEDSPEHALMLRGAMRW